RGYGPSNFLVGYPDFDFEAYHAWFDDRFAPAKFAQLNDKMGPMVKYASGSFIQSLKQNPGIEQYLQSLGTKCHVYVGTGLRALNKKWGCPEEPWASVSPNLLWNISNIPAAQISMLGKITGPAFAPIAACASFGVAAKMAVDAIALGEATAVVIGMTDPPPHG